MDDVRSIAAGQTRAAAVLTEGALAWGNNAEGQIGPAEARQLRPTPLLPWI